MGITRFFTTCNESEKYLKRVHMFLNMFKHVSNTLNHFHNIFYLGDSKNDEKDRFLTFLPDFLFIFKSKNLSKRVKNRYFSSFFEPQVKNVVELI